MRRPIYDPRTVAREIPGLFDSIFPQLTPGVVAHYNRRATKADLNPVTLEMVNQSALPKAMLFEIAYAYGEALVSGQAPDWNDCINLAVTRQLRHFDARKPKQIESIDYHIARIVGENMATMLARISDEMLESIVPAPFVPGFQWISSGNGDFSAGSTLIEVKCTSRNFSASDFPQVVLYWLLSFSHSLEHGSRAWDKFVLVNPALGSLLEVNMDDFLDVIAAGRAKVDIVELFCQLVGDRRQR